MTASFTISDFLEVIDTALVRDKDNIYTVGHSLSRVVSLNIFWHVPPAVGLIRQLLCIPFGDRNL